MAAIASRFVEMGVSPSLARELANQINTKTGNVRRLVELGVQPGEAKRIVGLISGTAISANRLAETSLIPRVVKEIIAATISAAVPVTAPAAVANVLATQLSAVAVTRNTDGTYGFAYTPANELPATFDRTVYFDTAGSNGDGLSWATAKTTIAGIQALTVAGTTTRVFSRAASLAAGRLMATPSWGGAQMAGKVYWTHTTPAFPLRSVKSASNVPPTYTQVSGAIYSAPLTAANACSVVDFAYEWYPFDIAGGPEGSGTGFAVNDTVTLSNGAVINVVAVAGVPYANPTAIMAWSFATRPTTTATTAVATAPTVVSTSGAGTGLVLIAAPNAARVIDPLVRAVSQAAMTAGTYFNDTSTLYVWARDSRNLLGDTNLIPLTGQVNGRTNQTENGAVLYLEGGIDFIGGTPIQVNNVSTVTGQKLRLIGCSTQSSGGPPAATAGVNNLSVQANIDIVLYNHSSYYAWADNLNYHMPTDSVLSSTVCPKVVEINCTSMGAGMTGSVNPSDNLSTQHEGSSAATFGGFYIFGDDNCIADGNASGGTMRWVVGARVGPALSAQNGSKGSFVVGPNATMYVEGTTVKRGLGSTALAVGPAPSNIYWGPNNSPAAVTNDPSGTGTVGTY